MFRGLTTAWVLSAVLCTGNLLRAEEKSVIRQLDTDQMLGDADVNSNQRALVCKGRRRDAPLAIKDAKALATVFRTEATRNRIAEQVDFGKEQLILIAWRGWSNEKTQTRTEGERTPKVVFVEPFRNDPRSVNDSLQNHVYLYVIPQTTTWRYFKAPDPNLRRIDPGGVPPR